MKLATFADAAGSRIGIVQDDAVVDLQLAAPDLPYDMTDFLALGPAGLDAAHAAVDSGARLPLAEVRLEAPVPRPGKFLAVGLNYAEHIREMGMARPEFPSCFAKLRTCIAGPYADVQRPRVSDSLDYEGELGLVIGRRCRHVPRERAAEVIAGYTVVNDFTVRDWVRRTPQVVIPKSFDTHGPFGPWLVTPEEVGDPHDLALRTWVNGELRQDGRTSDMIFDCYDLVEILSRAVTLEPGDVLTTGTPPGVGEGFDPKRYLKRGDVVRVEIENVGRIENRIVDEPAGSAVL